MTGLKRLATLLVLCGLVLPCLLIADGGAVLFQRHAGPFVVTLFSASAPLRSGPADLSVLLVSAADNQPVLDATVTLNLAQEGKQQAVPATHAEATNKLLYAATPDLPKAGKWQAAILIDQHGTHAEATGIIDVLPGPPRLLDYWLYFAIVPLMIALFLVHQRLKRREVRGRI